MTQVNFREQLNRLSSDMMDEDGILEVFQSLETFYEEELRHDYSQVSDIVFQQVEGNEIFDYNIEEIIKLAVLQGSSYLNSYKKLKDHLKLSLIQKKFIEDSLRSLQGEMVVAKAEIQQAMSEASSTVAKIEQQNTQIGEIEERSKKITTDFVSILGIFSSVIFAAFGGLEILKNILGNIEKVQTGKLLVFSSLTTGSIVFLVFLLLNGLSKLTRLNLRSCDCEHDECKCNLVQKHPSIVIINIILLFLFLIGLSEYVFDYKKMFGDVMQNIGSVFKLLILAGSSMLFFYGSYWWFRKMKNQNNNPENT